MTRLPQGTVTLLFTDIEGSTRLLHHLGEGYGDVLAAHQRLLREAIAMHGGVEVDTQGDAFLVAFPTAPDAVAAAVVAQRSLAAHQWPKGGEVRVRMGLHTGTPALRADSAGYVGVDVHRAARIAGATHGGQVLLSAVTLALSADALPEGVTVRDLGAHRLKDINQPERLHQLLIDGLVNDFPPPKTLDAHPDNLPAQATAFIGREREVAAVAELLRREGTRLVTLTGPGGTGKTRLALAVAAEALEDFSDGVWFVPLAALTDPALVPSAIAGALHVREAGGEPLPETVKAYLRDKELLLVLDNFEQVAEAAPLVGELLAACPALKAMATSRVPLRVYGEREYPVTPLALPRRRPPPKAEQLPQYEAVRLFIDRAVAVKPDFAVTNDNAPAVAEICHRLDGLPLAIELAAARVRLLPPEALLTRLGDCLKLLTGGARDLPARQRTLRGAIDWSHDLLDGGERMLFRRLAVFAGGATLEAIAAVCDAEGDLAVDVLDGVESLMSNSLLRQEEGLDREARIGMLETIREYATDQLEHSGEAERVREGHASYFLALAERAAIELRGPDAPVWLTLLDSEHDNLRTAIGWAIDHGKNEMGLRLAAALWRFWHNHGYIGEGRYWTGRALRDADEEAPALRGEVLLGSVSLAISQNDYQTARGCLEESVAIYQMLGDKQGMARSVGNLGILARDQGDYTAARRFFEDGLELARERGDKRTMALSLGYLGLEVWRCGEYPAARRLFEEALAIAQELGDMRGIAEGLNHLGMLESSAGDQPTARRLFEKALTIARGLGNKQAIFYGLASLGILARDKGDLILARELLEEGLAIAHDLGERQSISSSLANLGRLAYYEGNYPTARGFYQGSLDLAQASGDKSRIISCLEGLASVVAMEQGATRAVRLFSAAAAQREELGIARAPRDRAEHEQDLAATRARLEPIAWEAAWEEGCAMSPEEAVAYAREGYADA